MRRGRGMAAILACGLLGVQAAGAQACSIDGKPTLTVNGFSVLINTQTPTGPSLRLWAPFVLSFPLHTGRAETLAEIKQGVPLPVEAFRTPWRWNFGDGTAVARGISVHHVFRKPGVYKITVDAYFPSHKFWYTFDAVQVHVLQG